MYTFEQLEEKYRALPADIRQALDSVDVANALQNLGEKYKLHLDKVDELLDETSMVMLGVTDPGNFQDNLRRRLEIPDDVARDLAEEINGEIFLPIRESLKKIQKTREEVGGEIDLRPAAVANPPAALSDEDKKIFAEHGMEIKVGGAPAAEQYVPQKETAANAPSPAGLADVFKLPELPSGEKMVSPEKKLEAAVKMPVSESVYANGEKGAAGKMPPKTIDPYREPIS